MIFHILDPNLFPFSESQLSYHILIFLYLLFIIIPLFYVFLSKFNKSLFDLAYIQVFK